MKKKHHTVLPSSPSPRELAPAQQSDACAYPTLGDLRGSSSRALVERIAHKWWAPMAVASALTVSSFANASTVDAQERRDATTEESRQERQERLRERRRRERERARQDPPRPDPRYDRTAGVPRRVRHDGDSDPFL